MKFSAALGHFAKSVVPMLLLATSVPAVRSIAGEIPRTLDGLVFSGVMIVDHTGAEIPETITFANGSFHSAASDTFGYSDGPYTMTRDGTTVSFQAFTESPSLGYMAWTGVIASDRLVAKARAKDPGTAETTYSIRAVLQD